MKQRIITGFIGGMALITILAVHPRALTIVMPLICAAGVYELLTASRNRHRGIMAASILYAAFTPFFMSFGTFLPALAAVLAYTAAVTVIQIVCHDSLPVEKTGFAFMSTLIYSFAFSCLAYLRDFDGHGLFYVFLAFVIPWLCDIGAYFTGTLLGRHKLCPAISPKKTVEGLIGGIAVSISASMLTGLAYQRLFLSAAAEGASVQYIPIALLALAGAPLSVIGDLFASIIKRQFDVKDFGNVFPGHGGVIDRFDSMLLVSPLIFLTVYYIGLIA